MKKRKSSHSEVDYWATNTDMMTGLVLVLILIILMLILYLMQIPEDRLPDAQEGDSWNTDSELGDSIEEDDAAGWYHEADDREDSDDGGEEAAEDEEEEEEYEQEEGGSGGLSGDNGFGTEDGGEYLYPSGGGWGDDWGKAAVYTTVIDAETGRAILEKGIVFELYEEQVKGDGGAIRFLNTYYPVKTEYQNYETTEQGVFFLPEKIQEGNYYFKQISEVEGYDLAEKVQFSIDDVYDWSDPYVVSIEISPSKNIITVTLEDMDTHEPVQGGSFEVVAAEEILTADGTVRYAKNEGADTITIDEDGYGQSKELYLGEYTVSQETIPQYYASIETNLNTEVSEKDGRTREPLVFVCEKTQVEVDLIDEYTGQSLRGAEFALICENEPEFSQEGITDENGKIIFTNLEKNQTYELRQKSAPENYRFSETITEIFVEENGRIDGEAKSSVEVGNYIPRMNIGVKDRIWGKPISNISAALYSDDDQLIRSWTTSGSEMTFDNLSEGDYYVLLEDDENRRYDFTFSEDEVLQELSITIWSMEDIAVVAVGCAAAAIGVSVVVVFLRKRRKGTSL